jgi:methionine-gamma-lyase
MPPYRIQQGISSLVNHLGEGNNPKNAHITPIYETSTFVFPDVATGVRIWKNEEPGYIYTRLSNPNMDQLATKYAALEGLDILRAAPETELKKLVDGMVFSSGMAAITSAILALVQSGDTIIAQEALYGATFTFLNKMSAQYGFRTVWLHEPSIENWEKAFKDHPHAKLAYVETPSNPTMSIVDLASVVEIAHRSGAWVMADNTFATPYCQRPLTLGADVVAHSTTKYLNGHGLIIGGAVISRYPEFINGPLASMLTLMGGCPSPFDCWLANNGLKTFELRMERHCANAMAVARFLENHTKVATVNYPGLESHPDHAIASRQMSAYGGTMSFELKGGFKAGETLMNRVRLATLAVSLGTVDTLIQHPASMTHSTVPEADRLNMGITNGLVRLSVGIENIEDTLEDLDQALEGCQG